MLVYLAGSTYQGLLEKVNYKFNRLETFWDIYNKKVNPKHIKLFNNYILDSGAFTFIMAKRKNKDLKIDINYFTDCYIDFINTYDIKLFFEMDVDVVVGYDKVLKLREKIESKTGKRCIPVFHKNRGLKDWKDMINEYDYAAIGIAGKDFSFNNHEVFKKFVMDAAYKGCKIHGLGITGMTVLDKVPFYSVDSSSWTIGNRYKYIFYFKDGKILQKRNEINGKRIKNHEALSFHNLKEWIKFSNYAKNEL